MKTSFSSNPLGWCVKISLCLIASLILVVNPVNAITLTDGNSSTDIDPTSQLGMYNWFVDGQDILAKQWFWYRIGGGPEFSIDTISPPVNSSLGINNLKSSYTHGAFTLSVEYSLTGGSPLSGVATLNESIAVHNTTATPLTFHFFQYSDFDLGPGGDFVQLGTNIFGKLNEAEFT